MKNINQFIKKTGRIIVGGWGVAILCIQGAQGQLPPALHYYEPLPKKPNPQQHIMDICVYGATSSGVIAAVQAARMGKSVALFAFGTHIGGLSASGLNRTDGGSKDVTGGIAREFYSAVGDKGFAASDAEAAFNALLQQESVAVHYRARLWSVVKKDTHIKSIIFENGDTASAKMFIDATYEGDLMAMAGVSYTVGREGNDVYGETHNGQWTGQGHNFSKKVDPYRIENDPSSGLLAGISDRPFGQKGQGDTRIQAYCFRMHLSRASDRLSFQKPPGYDPEAYALLARYLQTGVNAGIRLGIDVNNHHLVDGAFFTDYVGQNYAWPDGVEGVHVGEKDSSYLRALYQTRQDIFYDHVVYQQGLLYFLANDPSVRQDVRTEFARWGLPADEYQQTGGWPHELYIREGRRMVSSYIMTEHDCNGSSEAPEPIALGEYRMDSHHCQRVVVFDEDGSAYVTNEGNVEIDSKKGYGISFQSVVPQNEQCSNLFVSCAVSASHIAYGSIRMEPVFMSIGQSGAIAAALALDMGSAIQDVPYALLREQLLAVGQIVSHYQGESQGDCIVIDNLSEGYSELLDGWQSARSADGYFGVDYRYRQPGEASSVATAATWQATIGSQGWYSCKVRIPRGQENQAKKYTFIVSNPVSFDTLGHFSVMVDSVDSNSWYQLDHFFLEQADQIEISLQLDPENTLLADAVLLEKTEAYPPPPVRANSAQQRLRPGVGVAGNIFTFVYQPELRLLVRVAGTMSVQSLNGKTVLGARLVKPNQSIELSHLAAGHYVVRYDNATSTEAIPLSIP